MSTMITPMLAANLFSIASREEKNGNPELAGILRSTAIHIDEAIEEIDALKREVKGWHRTALAMQQSATLWDRDGVSKYDDISRFYEDASGGVFVEKGHPLITPALKSQ